MNLNYFLKKRSIFSFVFFHLLGSGLLVLLLNLKIDEEKLISKVDIFSITYEVIRLGVKDLLILTFLRNFLSYSTLIMFYMSKSTFKIKMFYWPTYLVTIFIIGKAIAFDYSGDRSNNLFIFFATFSAIVDTFNLGCVFRGISVVSKYADLTDGDQNRQSSTSTKSKKSTQLSTSQLFTFLRSYFFPKGFMNKIRALLTFVFLAGSRGCNLASPIFIGRAVDALGDEEPDRSEVFKNVAIFTSLAILSRYLSEMQRLSYLKVGQVAFVEVSKNTFTHLHTLSLDWHLNKKLGKVLRSLFRGISSINTVVRLVFLNLLPTVVELVAVFIIFYKQFNLPLLSSLLFIAIVCYITLTFEMTQWRKKFRKETNKHDNEFHDKATDSLVNYETVKYFTQEKFETDRFVESIEAYQIYQNYTIATLALLNSAQTTIIQMSVMGALFIVATEFLLEDEAISVGDFVTAQVYMFNVFTPLNFLGSIYDTVIQAFVDISNLSELLANVPDVQDDPKATDFEFKNKPIEVGFNQVSFHYPSNVASGLRNVTFSVPAGQSLAIVGHTGAGKTTVGRLLFRFYDPLSGSIELAGQDIRKFTQDSIRRAIGVVPQDTVLFNESIKHNILYGKTNATEKEMKDACEAAQILDFIESLPEGFDTKVGERGLRLSGGEKQRVAIARCLLKNPPVVLLDEATSALDTRTEQKVQVALDTLTEFRTTLIIAHRLSTVKDANKIIVLSKGTILEQGSHDELLAAEGDYSKMWNAQVV